mgnify:FL=1
MSTSRQRDKACILAKQDSEKAAKLAQDIHDPWYRAQALCWVVRFIVGDPSKIASKVIKAASECDDHYKKACARAWLVAAFAERGELHHARKILSEAVELARCVEPAASKAEALVLLLQAAMSIGVQDAESVHDLL